MTNPAIWGRTGWLDSATSFIDETLRAHGFERTGPVTRSRVRPWSALVEAPSTAGRVWLKASSADTAFEVALHGHLRAVVPEHVLAPLGLDSERGWLVLPDGGTLLGHIYEGDALATALEGVMPRYAELQLRLMPHVSALVELGVSDMTAPVMPQRFAQALASVHGFLERNGGADDWRDFRAIAALERRFAASCAELDQAPGRATLDHNDLHPWNIFAEPDNPESARFFDWGDSVVAHPFASLLVLLVTLQSTLEVPADDTRLQRVRDAYLEPFEVLGPRRELVETVELACWVARATRALTWQRAIGDPAPEDYAGIPFGKLRELLEPR